MLNPTAVTDKIRKEVEAGRVEDPFDWPPLKNFQCSPLSISQKMTPGQYRLLHNLSYLYSGQSVNANIPGEFASVQYSTIKDAIELTQKHPSQYHLMGFTWEGKY